MRLWFYVIFTMALGSFAHAELTWERAYSGYQSDEVYNRSYSPPEPMLEEIVGTNCLKEGEVVTAISSKYADYEYNVFEWEDVICCGENLSCPRERRDEE